MYFNIILPTVLNNKKQVLYLCALLFSVVLHCVLALGWRLGVALHCIVFSVLLFSVVWFPYASSALLHPYL